MWPVIWLVTWPVACDLTCDLWPVTCTLAPPFSLGSLVLSKAIFLFVMFLLLLFVFVCFYTELLIATWKCKRTSDSSLCIPRNLVSSPGNLARPISILLSQDETSSFSFSICSGSIFTNQQKRTGISRIFYYTLILFIELLNDKHWIQKNPII